MGAKENIRNYVKKWQGKGYEKGIPDEAPIQLERQGLVPSYRIICIAIMKNPNNLEVLGFTRKKCQYYSHFKRIELKQKDKIKQMDLFYD